MLKRTPILHFMKLIIFDIDGTLADTKQVDDACFIDAFYSTFKIDIQAQKWEAITNLTDWGITEEIIQNHWNRLPTKEEYIQIENKMIQKLEAKKKENQKYFQEISGANKFFHQLQNKPNITLGIATGAWEKSALIKLGSIGINPQNIPFSNSNHFKTREEITNRTIQEATKNSPVSFEEIIYFGDGVWDFKTCRNLGIRFIGIDVLQDGKLRQLGAKEIFKDYSDTRSIMEVLGL